MIIEPAKRTQSVREYYFSRKLKEIDKLNNSRVAEGKDKIINLGIGAPDGMPPAQAIAALQEAAAQPGNHAYQSYVGLPALRQAFADWYERYYKVTLNPDGEIQPLFGSKEGILLISMAFINEGDKVLVPDPGYPTYTSASNLVGADIVTYDLTEENGWQPDFEALEKMDLSGVKIMWTNYPHMPTGAKATAELYQKIVDFGNKHNILIVNDNPYSFILNDNPLSILAAEGAKNCCLELNSLSKAHNMSGWRIGMVAGAKEIIAEVLKVKSQMDSGMFKPMQMAAVKALEQGPEWFSTSAMISFEPPTIPILQPDILWALLRELSSRQQSIAPFAARMERGLSLRMKLYGLSLTINMLCFNPKSTSLWYSSGVALPPVGILG